MNPNPKVAVQVFRQALTAAGTEIGTAATTFVDTKGYDYGIALLAAQTSTGTWSLLSVSSSDTSNDAAATTHTINLVGGTATSTSAGFVIGSSPTAGQWLTKFGVDFRSGTKRYVKVNAVPNATATADVVWYLYKGEQSPDTATLAGVTAVAAG